MTDTDTAPQRPRLIYAWYVVGVLSVAATLSFVDRQILNLLVEPIRRDLQINDFQISLLQGLAFSLFYALAGVPLGILADRKNRRNIIIIGVTFWSLMTALCGVAGKFWYLFLARVGVGVGEATLSPSGYSMISDYFPKDKLALAMSFFTMGNLMGAGLAFIVGGAVAGMLSGLETYTLPVVGEVFPWQVAFFVVAAPGLILALVFFTVREPKRKGQKQKAEDTVPIVDVLRFVGGHWKSFATLFAGFILLVLVAYGFFSWVPAYYQRVHGFSIAQSGYTYGLIVALCGTSGAIFGGALSNWLAKRGHTDAPFRASLISAIPMAPLAGLAFLTTDSDVTTTTLIFYQFLTAMPAGLAGAAMMSITPNELRGQVSSLYLLASNLVGLTLGPSIVGGLNEFYFQDIQQVGRSLVITTCIFGPLAALFLAIGMKHFRKSVLDQSALDEFAPAEAVPAESATEAP